MCTRRRQALPADVQTLPLRGAATLRQLVLARLRPQHDCRAQSTAGTFPKLAMRKRTMHRTLDLLLFEFRRPHKGKMVFENAKPCRERGSQIPGPGHIQNDNNNHACGGGRGDNVGKKCAQLSIAVKNICIQSMHVWAVNEGKRRPNRPAPRP